MTTMGAGQSRGDERDPLLRKAKGFLGYLSIGANGGDVEAYSTSVDGSEIRLTQLRLVAYCIIYRVLLHPRCCRISSINSMMYSVRVCNCVHVLVMIEVSHELYDVLAQDWRILFQ